MSTINSLPNNSLYYQLGGNPSDASSVSGTNSLLQALNDAASDSNSTSPLDTVNLSPAAKQYLSGLNSGSAATAALTGASASFTLTTQQQQAISAIIAKYKDAPYTQDTFNQIQNDLNDAGLGSSQLSMQDQAKNFNATQLLIDALSGKTTQADNFMGNAGEQTKSNHYMQQIISQWKTISTTADAADGVTPTAATGGA